MNTPNTAIQPKLGKPLMAGPSPPLAANILTASPVNSWVARSEEYWGATNCTRLP
jgi:hypothetical protein